ncbi:MAG: molybdopterin cofactor-binding domain-containing protein, partial [Burkholderiaceae bacterium]
MSRRADQPHARADYRAAAGVLLVQRTPPVALPPAKRQPTFVAGNPAEGPEILLAVWDDGSVTGLHGHVDLGTGIATALTQIVAEEIDVAPAAIRMVLGSTASAPNQGATIASSSIQVHAVPLRAAAAQARGWLLGQAAVRLGAAVEHLRVDDGVVHVEGDATADVSVSICYADLVHGRHIELDLDPSTPPKPVAAHRIVGTSLPRTDIGPKARGELTFVHDLRVPGMLHGRVVRPPYSGADHGDFIGNTLEEVDEASIAHIPGIRAVVVIRDFVGIVAEREEHAEQALRELRVRWKPWPGMPDLSNVAQALRNNYATTRKLVDEGDVEGAIASASQRFEREYLWPYQLHASIGPSCAVAAWQPDAECMTVWSGTQNPHVLRADLSRLLQLPDVAVDVIRMEAAGCYGRNSADDVTADAALLSKAVNAPVRVQLTREQEHLWEPKGAAQLMTVRGGLNADGAPAAYDFETSYPSNAAPTLALLLTRTIEPGAHAFEMGDRTARPPYAYEHLRVTVRDMAPILRASWLRGVSALPNSFAHESYIDELAHAAQVDPLAYRLRHLPDARAADLLRATADKADWLPHTTPMQQPTDGPWLRGQGVAYARYVHSKWPGYGAAWSAWVADVDVHRDTGEVQVRRVVVGHDAGLVINPKGVEHQVHGNVLQTTSRALFENLPLTAKDQTPAAREWGAYPILNFTQVPVIDVVMMPRRGDDDTAFGVGESASVSGTAAIANAIFDATGVRLRAPPFTPEVVRAAMLQNGLAGGGGSVPPSGADADASARSTKRPAARWPAAARAPARRRPWRRTAALFAGAAGLTAAALGWRPAIAPVASSAPASSLYTAESIERGRQLAAIGDCAVCHTADGGARNAGGRPLPTPFGTLHSTNLTPDVATGIGAWSFSAFQRAMREGISRDGQHLYPAFPYTAYAKTSDDDLMALYAYLMSEPAVASVAPPNDLRFPFNQRALMPAWNALFHDPAPFQPEAAQSAEWNRGAYLVNGLGHCGACHTPRNALGAERSGTRYLSGAFVDGWEAPALTSFASNAPIAWNTTAFYDYLRHGHSREHGSALGPMTSVVRELADVPDADIRAMAVYLGSFN